MANRSTGIYGHFGSFSATNQLPNVAGADVQTRELRIGDLAAVAGALYICTTPTLGAAVWAAVGGAATRDHQTAKYIVGNELAGDTIDVCDFLDPGDGSGFAAAIAAAVAAAPLDFSYAGDIYLRPGAYNMGLPGSPALPLELPTIVTIRAAVSTNDLGCATIVVGDSRQLFTQNALLGSALLTIENVNVALSPVVGVATGDVVIGTPLAATTMDIILRNVHIIPPVESAGETVTHLVNGISTEVVGGGVLSSSFELVAYRGESVIVRDASINQVAVGIESFAALLVEGSSIVASAGIVASASSNGTPASITGNTLSTASSSGVCVDISTPDSAPAITGNTFSACGTAVRTAATAVVTGNRVGLAAAIGVEILDSAAGSVVSGNVINGNGSSIGISAQGLNAAITGNTLLSHDVGVDVAVGASRTLIVGNTISSSATMAIQDAGAGTITGTNIT